MLSIAVPGRAEGLRDAGNVRSRAALDHALSAIQDGALRQAQPRPPAGGGLSGAKLSRVKGASLSLLVPGWSQYRAGHRTRALFFGSAELAIWSGWAFSKIQGASREDRYQGFAQQFARVQSTDHGDDYWRAVASYRSSDEFNENVRRDLRAELDPDGPEYSEADGWNWQSEQRFDEFKSLRGDSISSYDRADLIILFAIVNRVVAFVDAVRSGGGEENELELESAGMSLRLDMDPNPQNPGTTLSLGRRF